MPHKEHVFIQATNLTHCLLHFLAPFSPFGSIIILHDRIAKGVGPDNKIVIPRNNRWECVVVGLTKKRQKTLVVCLMTGAFIRVSNIAIGVENRERRYLHELSYDERLKQPI